MRHADGLFLFDVWYGPAVIAQKPGDRSVETEKGGCRILRRTRAHLDTNRKICDVHFDLTHWDEVGRATEWEEDHSVRYFFRADLESHLADFGLQLLDLLSFPEGRPSPDADTWNVIGIARAI